MTEILQPGTVEQVVEAVAWASAEETPIEIVGTGTKRGYGRPMGDVNRTVAHGLDLSGLSGITLYEPEELVLTAGAGTPVAEIEAAVAAKGQMLAFEPPRWARLYGQDGGTLGGLVACNLAGPRRVKSGAARDHVLGFACVTGRGELVRSGGRVVKNVTGYDLSKLLTGSFGTLAAMTEITVKVLPAAETEATVLVEGLDDAGAVAAMARGLNSSHEVSGAAHLPGHESGPVTALRIEGFVPSVEARTRALCALLGDAGAVRTLDAAASRDFWAKVRDAAPFAAGEGPLWRLSVTPDRSAAIVAAIRDAAGGDVLYDWGGGLVWYAPGRPGTDAAAAAVRGALAADGGGHATLVRAPDAMRRTVDVFQPQPAALAALSRRVKESFDPHHVLNPGRMYEGV
jgi:glycolate oxidase FAD binding subunit